jgi:hypothetical protein
MIEPTIRAVVFQEGDWWIIHFLEYDLATAVRRLEDVPGEVRRFLLVQIVASIECGIEPFHGFPPSPRRYWKMFEAAGTRMETVQLELPPEIPAGPEPYIDTRIAA